MLSIKKNFLFIHVPKTAGNSIQTILKDYSEDRITTHRPPHDGIECFGVINAQYNTVKHSNLTRYKQALESELYDKLFKFATIRNPYERVISFYFSRSRGIKNWDRNQFIKFIETSKNVKPLEHFIVLHHKPILKLDQDIDFLMRFENLDKDFGYICDKIGIPKRTLPKINISQRQHYSKYYDTELKEMVASKFRLEIEFGNYQLEQRTTIIDMKTAKKDQRRKIAHIIQPAIVDKSSDLFVAQPITFETMKIAQKMAQDQMDVALYYAKFFDENISMPEEFQATRDLNRSILDIATFGHKRKLPLLKDILDRLYETATDAEYLIYTNVDIALMPHFYLVVNELIEKGYDAFIINRRTISQTYQSVSDIPFMYCEIGKSHPGIDCFVFKRNVYPNYFLGNVCIGTRYIGKVLLFNLICHAVQFEEFKALHLTFHIGNDRVWQLDKNKDYPLHNFNELKKIVKYYQESQQLPNHPRVDKIMAKLINPQIPEDNNIPKATTIDIENDKKAYNISPTTEMDSTNPQQLGTMIHQAVAQLNANQNVEALKLLEIILLMQPELIGLHYGKALALTRLKRIDEAIELLSRVSTYRPAKLLLDELKIPENLCLHT